MKSRRDVGIYILVIVDALKQVRRERVEGWELQGRDGGVMKNKDRVMRKGQIPREGDGETK